MRVVAIPLLLFGLFGCGPAERYPRCASDRDCEDRPGTLCGYDVTTTRRICVTAFCRSAALVQCADDEVCDGSMDACSPRGGASLGDVCAPGRSECDVGTTCSASPVGAANYLCRRECTFPPPYTQDGRYDAQCPLDEVCSQTGGGLLVGACLPPCDPGSLGSCPEFFVCVNQECRNDITAAQCPTFPSCELGQVCDWLVDTPVCYSPVEYAMVHPRMARAAP